MAEFDNGGPAEVARKKPGQAPDGKIVATIVANDDGNLAGVHLLRFDGASARLDLPGGFDSGLEQVLDRLADPEDVKRLLAGIEMEARSVIFEFGSYLSKRAECEGTNPVKAGNPRYFGMGWWGYDIGVIDAVAPTVGDDGSITDSRKETK